MLWHFLVNIKIILLSYEFIFMKELHGSLEFKFKDSHYLSVNKWGCKGRMGWNLINLVCSLNDDII